jgi:hypothetical protein
METGTAEPPRRRIRNPKDFYGGLALMALGLVGWWGSLDLGGSKGVYFGAGTAPRLFSGLLILIAAAVTVTGVTKDGPALGGYPIRGPVFVSAAVLIFAAMITPLGLPLTSFITILVAAAASPETRWIESILWAAALSVASTLLFVTALGLSIPIWPSL